MTPAPLVPACVDLRDFRFYPIDAVRLRDSRFSASVTGEEFRAGILLWLAAWHQVPAASLPDDDIELAQLAGFGRVVSAWREVRAGALYGWVKCSDGRLYHPVMAEKAIEGWNSKLVHQWKKECDRLRKENKAREQRGEDPIPLPDRPAEVSYGTTIAAQPTFAVAVDAVLNERSDVPEETHAVSIGTADLSGGNPAENALKGQGQGEGQGESRDTSLRSVSCQKPGKPVRTRSAYPSDFEEFWKPYPTDPNMSKLDAAKAWAKLTKDDRASACAAIPGFVAYCRANPDYRPVHAARFLTSKRFEGFAPSALTALVKDRLEERKVRLVNGVEFSISYVHALIEQGKWFPATMGPRPGEPGCLLPKDLWPKLAPREPAHAA